MSSMLSFTATAKKSPNKGGWHYIELRSDVLGKLRKLAGKNGNLPVVAKIGKTQWKSTIMSRGNQQWYLALNSGVREAEEIKEGDTVTANLTPDFDKLEKLRRT